MSTATGYAWYDLVPEIARPFSIFHLHFSIHETLYFKLIEVLDSDLFRKYRIGLSKYRIGALTHELYLIVLATYNVAASQRSVE